ncbi:MAG: ORF6N domain-containing protein [Ignavibacteriales bacterium]|nr:ORF6N domain-containing protein [Ignavibacteriales bacterium]
MKSVIKQEEIVGRIFFLRGEKVILDRDLASLYEVEVRTLNQSVKRNIKRFPNDFMFQLSTEEFKNLKSQFVISSWGGVRKLPLAFTEQGVAMFSGLLNSERAIKVNIEIMRAFVQLRRLIDSNKELAKKIEKLESKYDEQFKIVFEAIRQLIREEDKPKGKIGF